VFGVISRCHPVFDVFPGARIKTLVTLLFHRTRFTRARVRGYARAPAHVSMFREKWCHQRHPLSLSLSKFSSSSSLVFISRRKKR